jgi:hypothetical protein
MVENVNRLWQREDGVLLTMEADEEVTCSWTLVCKELATSIVEHPILGGVPVCQRHKEWVAANRR